MSSPLNQMSNTIHSFLSFPFAFLGFCIIQYCLTSKPRLTFARIAAGIIIVNILCTLFSVGSSPIFLKGQYFAIAAASKSKELDLSKSLQPWRFANINLYGVDKNTGEVIIFISVNNITDALLINSSAIELEDGNPKNNIMEAIFPFPHLLAKIGDKYKACAMVLKDFDYVCYIGRYSPKEGSQSISLLLNSYKQR
jgi:hypothetical protein